MKYFAVRHVDHPDLVRIERAPDPIEALYMAFGRARRGGRWEAKDVDRCVKALIARAEGWETI